MQEVFFGAGTQCAPVSNAFPGIDSPQALYDALRQIWCAATCAPRMRSEWTPENFTRGQCSVTAFLAQDIFGGRVLGLPLGDGNVHCFNEVDGACFDLTGAQFGPDAKLSYEDCTEQSRAVHFQKAEKKARYELLRALLRARTHAPGQAKAVRQMVTAHSGCDGTVMNSREYLVHALSLPVDAIEVDIRPRPEAGRYSLILSHDEAVPEEDLVPLEEVFALAAGSTKVINCDVKEPHLEAEVMAAAGRAAFPAARILFTGSVTDPAAVCSACPGVRVWLNPEMLDPDFYPRFKSGTADAAYLADICKRAKATGVPVINVNYKAAAGPLAEAARNAGLALSLWTVNDPAALTDLPAAVNLTSRNPGGIRAALAAGRTPDSARFFANTACAYYPCHAGADELNCLFCYCPFYADAACPGEPAYIDAGGRQVKDCSGCLFPHRPENYGAIIKAFSTKPSL